MKNFFILFMVSFITCFAGKNLQAQDMCSYLPAKDSCLQLPFMYVDTIEGKTRKDELMHSNFLKSSKYKSLMQASKSQKVSFYLKYNAVENLLDTFRKSYNGDSGLRLYFIRYIKRNGRDIIPDSLNNRVLLLWGFVANERSEPDSYYFLNDNKDDVLPVTRDKAIEYRKNFEVILRRLNKSVDKKDQSNLYQGKLSDTRSIYYDMRYIIQAVDTEYCYQKICQNNTIISGFQVFFSSYTKNGRNITRYDDGTYKKRLLIQFSYMTIKDGKIVPLFLEDEPHFECRKIQLFQKLVGETYLNNGKLCPPHCP